MSIKQPLQKVLVINGWSVGKRLWSQALQSLGSLAEEIEFLDSDSLGVYENFDAILNQKVKPGTLLIGWSLGVQMVIESLLKSKELSDRVIALVALQSTPCFIQKEGWNCGYPVESFGSLEQSCVDKDFTKVKRVFAHLLTQGSDSNRDDRNFLKKEYVNRDLPDQEVLLQGLRLLRSNDLRNEIGKLSVNTLWLFGEADALVPSKVKREMSEMGQFQVEVVSGMGHFPCGTYWQRVFDSIQRFIEVK